MLKICFSDVFIIQFDILDLKLPVVVCLIKNQEIRWNALNQNTWASY